MKKQDIIELFTGKNCEHPIKTMAEAYGTSTQAVSQWKDELGPRIIERLELIVKWRVAAGDKSLGRKFSKLIKQEMSK